MDIARLVSAKGGRVVTAPQETVVDWIVRRMLEERIGAVVVTGRHDGRIEGLVGERDILRALAAHGPRILKKRAGEVMTRTVRTCTPDDSLKHVMTVMTRERIRHMPVVQGHRLCGIVSIGDVVKYRLEEMALEVGVLRDLYIASGGYRIDAAS